MAGVCDNKAGCYLGDKQPIVHEVILQQTCESPIHLRGLMGRASKSGVVLRTGGEVPVCFQKPVLSADCTVSGRFSTQIHFRDIARRFPPSAVLAGFWPRRPGGVRNPSKDLKMQSHRREPKRGHHLLLH
jgi:hypothetical protein